VSSTFEYGVPLTLSASLSALDTAPGAQSGTVTLQFTGFATPGGAALTFAIISLPEAGSGYLLSLGIGCFLMLAGYRRARH